MSTTVTITTHHGKGRTYSNSTRWERRPDDKWCPECGVRGKMWSELELEGDYYLGVETVCLACGASLYLIHNTTESFADNMCARAQRLAQLRKAEGERP